MIDFSVEFNLENFIARIDFGDDIEFEYEGRRFTILGWYEGGPFISETPCSNKDCGEQFKDGSALVSGYKIDGVPLIRLLDKLVMH